MPALNVVWEGRYNRNNSWVCVVYPDLQRLSRIPLSAQPDQSQFLKITLLINLEPAKLQANKLKFLLTLTIKKKCKMLPGPGAQVSLSE